LSRHGLRRRVAEAFPEPEEFCFIFDKNPDKRRRDNGEKIFRPH
jgi:hypothetical protein